MGVSVTVDKPASATISDITFQGSSAKDQSALIWNAGKLTLKTCILSGNTASGYGGGINNSGALLLSNSTISGNTASVSGSGFGGGIYNSGTLTLTSSTISDNTVSISNFGSGSGIYNSSINSSSVTYATLLFCTIVNNRQKTPGSDGSDIISTEHSPMYMKANIVGENDAQSTHITGEITSGGYNLIQRISSVKFAKNTAHSTDRSVDDLTQVFGSSPVLGNNGGPTETFQLIFSRDNPAIGIIPQDACTDATGRRVLTDQRGMPRPGENKSSCDSGAYEYRAPS